MIICCAPSLPLLSAPFALHLCPSVSSFHLSRCCLSPLPFSVLFFAHVFMRSHAVAVISSSTSSVTASSSSPCSCFVIAAALNEFYIFIARPSSEFFAPASGNVWTPVCLRVCVSVSGISTHNDFFLSSYRFVTSIAALRLLFVVTLYRRVPASSTSTTA